MHKKEVSDMGIVILFIVTGLLIWAMFSDRVTKQ